MIGLKRKDDMYDKSFVQSILKQIDTAIETIKNRTKGSRKNNTTLIEANIFIMRAAIKSVATINGFITNKNTTKSI